MSSTDPAWMPPIIGSTSVSTMPRPNLRATSGPTERSLDGAADVGAGQHGVADEGQPAAQGRGCPIAAVGHSRVGIPITSPSGRRRSLPRAHTEAPLA